MNAYEIARKLNNKGFEAYFVGGYVRDMILGRESNDIDVTTNARPNTLINLFSDCRVNLVGKSFGVVIIDGIEVSTYRSDKYSGLSDKNVEIKFAKTIEEDLSRRDFTMNSIAYNPFKKVYVDPFNGIKDITNKKITFVGIPKDRIFEDPCRVLRAIRFYTVLKPYGFEFDIDTSFALKHERSIVGFIAPERIRIEIMKTLKSADYKVDSFFRTLESYDMLKYVFPSLNRCVDIGQNRHHDEDVFEHNMLCGRYLPKEKPLLRLAGFLHDVGKPDVKAYFIDIEDCTFIGHEHVGAEIAEKDLRALKFSNYEVEYVTGLIKMHMRIVNKLSKPGIRRLVKKLNELDVSIDDFLALKGADARANLKKRNNYIEGHTEVLKARIDEVLNEKPPFSVRDLRINGNDIMNVFDMKPCPEIGRILNILMERVLDNPELNHYEHLLTLACEVKE